MDEIFFIVCIGVSLDVEVSSFKQPLLVVGKPKFFFWKGAKT
jgi:hypothetical protein